jgi:DNA-binding XRE family transcriptional regulator
MTCELFLLTERLSLLLSTMSKIIADLGLEQQESYAQTKRERSNPPLHELRYQRKMRHWTQADLADALYQICSPEEIERGRGIVNANMVGAWERGEHLPGLFWQKKLCLLFDTTPQHLGFLQRGEVTA